MSGNRTRSSTSTSTNQQGTSTSSTPGTSWGTNVLNSVDGAGIAQQVQTQGGGFQGDTQATMPTPANGFVAQWNQAPSTFVPQRTTADAPTQVQQTHVDPNYVPGIQAGIDNANAQSGTLANLSNQGLTRWGEVLSGGSNPALDALLARMQQEHTEGAAQSFNAAAATAGQAGAFGGTDMARQNTWMAEQQQQELDGAVAQLLWQDYDMRNQMLLNAPGAIAGMAGIGDLTAQRLLEYGGLQQGNEMAAAATADANAQADANNAWNQGTLVDQNADRAAQDALAAWEAAYQVDSAATAEGVAQAENQQANTQAGLNNDYNRWASDRDAMSTMIEQLQALLGLSSAVPGGTVESTQSGTGTSNTTQSTSGDPLATLGGLLGAGLQFFAPGFGTAATSIPRFGTSPSERRLKAGIKDLFVDERGLRWYTYHYKNDPSKTMQTGVMADEIFRLVPEAVEVIDGVHNVNYDTLAEWRR